MKVWIRRRTPMRSESWGPPMGVLLVLATCTAAHAQGADHLECYKGNDPLKLAAVVDLNAAQLGLQPGCSIAPAKLFCVPVTKTVEQATDKGTRQPIVPQVVLGADPGERICYKVKCPAAVVPDQLASDQFGKRTFGKLRAFLLCAPAVTGPPPPVCGGTFPTCNGACPTGEACALVDGFSCGCLAPVCTAPTPCGASAVGTCDGACPAGTMCGDIGLLGCGCVANGTTPCGSSTAPTCGGACPGAAATCQHFVDVFGVGDFCSCVSSGIECGTGIFSGGCLGTCPPGQTCAVSLSAGECGGCF
jgi:hypothetical protein